MHKAMLKAMRSVNSTTQKNGPAQPPPKKTIVAEVCGQASSPLQCPIQAARTFTVDGNLKNVSNSKEIRGVEFVIDTGCQFAVVIPTFVADQIGLDETSYIGSFGVNTADGGSLDAPTYKILLTIGGIPILTTVAVSGTAGVKALIGAELLSLFDLRIVGDSCRLSLVPTK